MKKKARSNEFHTRTTYLFYRVRATVVVGDKTLRLSLPDKGHPPVELLIEAPKPQKSQVHPTGGITTCSIEVLSPNGEMISIVTGFAVCSMSDKFSYETGKALAHERAVFAVKHIARILEGEIEP
jgi:hypothetical protein